MNGIRRISAILIASILVFSGCVFAGKNKWEIGELGPPLLRLTSAVQGVAARPDLYGLQEGESGEDCLRLGIEDDPSLLDPFEGLSIKVKCENYEAIVLLCDGNTALFEDLGCTEGIDYPKGNSIVRASCDFHIDPVVACPK